MYSQKLFKEVNQELAANVLLEFNIILNTIYSGYTGEDKLELTQELFDAISRVIVQRVPNADTEEVLKILAIIILIHEDVLNNLNSRTLTQEAISQINLLTIILSLGLRPPYRFVYDLENILKGK